LFNFLSGKFEMCNMVTTKMCLPKIHFSVVFSENRLHLVESVYLGLIRKSCKMCLHTTNFFQTSPQSFFSRFEKLEKEKERTESF